MLAAGCGGSEQPPAPDRTPKADDTPAPARVPPLCEPLRARVLGRVGPPAAEVSGLVRAPSGRFWAHNDSGDEPRIFAFDARGRITADVALAGAEQVDWEDMAVRGRTLYIGDIGDNQAQRPEIAVYRVREGEATAERIPLRYPDGPRDAEALLVDPRDGTIVIVTKDFSGRAGVYSGRRALRRDTELDLGLGAAITAGDVSADGATIVLRSYDRAYVWTRRGGESIARALEREPCVAGANLLAEGQGESLALSADGRSFWTLPEGDRPALRRYSGG